ncbi:MAG: LAGLIDADG family homing endonuclease [Nanoarchaeota archaeon]
MRIKPIKSDGKLLSIPKTRIIAKLMADGCVSKTRNNYVIKYEVKDKESLEIFKQDMFIVYGLNMHRGFKPSGKTGEPIPFVKLLSKNVYYDLLRYGNYYSYNWRLPKQIKNANKKIKIEFLKAFYDDEGSVINYNTNIEVRLYSINKKGLLDLKSLIEKFGINSRLVKGYGLKRNVYAIVINKKNDIKLFSKIIGFNLERKQEKLTKFINNNL